jgi:ornithine cyclodeaminase/alanine dehydrogenase-like protein (mu-crystallin family)
VWSRNPDRAHELARTAGVDVDIRVHDSPGAAAAKADVVVTCTPSREPLISAADLLDEALVVAMGADSPGKRELAGDVVEDAVVVVDDPVGALAVGEATHLAGHARQAVLGDLGSLLIGAITLPDLAGKRVVFDSVGVAYVDTAVAALVVAQAEAKGLGESFTFGDQGSA